MLKCFNEDCLYFREHGECSEVCTNQGIMKIVTNADRIRNMTDEELARFIHRIDHYFNYEEYIWVVRFEDVEIEDNQINILEWLQSQIKPEF